jgi:hypothetical protein
MPKHELVAMEFMGRSPRKSKPTPTYKKGKNIWFSTFKCPVCGDLLQRLANLKIKAPAMCDGIKYAKQNALRRSHFAC